MFVANIAPRMIVTGASGLSVQETASLIQTAMIFLASLTETIGDTSAMTKDINRHTIATVPVF